MKARKYNLKKLLKASDDDIAKTLDSLFRRKTDYFERSLWNDPRRTITKTLTKTEPLITIHLWHWDDTYTVIVREATITLLHDNKFHGKTLKTIFGESDEESDEKSDEESNDD